MLKAWAVLLFCGLLTPSWGLDAGAQVISRVSANGLEKVIANLLHGGDILQSVLGTVSTDNGGLLNLGNLLGPRLIGLEIKNLTLPKVSLQLVPGLGMQLKVYTKVSIDGRGLLDRVLGLQAEVNITARARLIRDDTGAPKLMVENCKTQFVNIRILLNLLQLPLRVLNNGLGNILPGVIQLCPLIDTTLNSVNSLLHTANSVAPLGALGNLQYTLSKLPVVSGGSIKMDLNAVVKDLLGNAIRNPTCSAAPISLPLVDGSSQLGLSVCLIASVIKLLLVPETLNADITGQMLPTNIPLTTLALRSVIPEVSGLLPESQQPLLKVKVLEALKVSWQNGKITVHLPASIEVSLSGSPQNLLFVLDADVVLSVQPTIADNKLLISLTLESVNLGLTSSQIGKFNVTRLEPLISDLLRIAYVPHINGALDVEIPLPNLLSLNLENGIVKVINNVLVINAVA